VGTHRRSDRPARPLRGACPGWQRLNPEQFFAQHQPTGRAAGTMSVAAPGDADSGPLAPPGSTAIWPTREASGTPGDLPPDAFDDTPPPASGGSSAGGASEPPPDVPGDLPPDAFDEPGRGSAAASGPASKKPGSYEGQWSTQYNPATGKNEYVQWIRGAWRTPAATGSFATSGTAGGTGVPRNDSIS
jgi:hypothetical protein